MCADHRQDRRQARARARAQALRERRRRRRRERDRERDRDGEADRESDLRHRILEEVIEGERFLPPLSVFGSNCDPLTEHCSYGMEDPFRSQVTELVLQLLCLTRDEVDNAVSESEKMLEMDEELGESRDPSADGDPGEEEAETEEISEPTMDLGQVGVFQTGLGAEVVFEDDDVVDVERVTESDGEVGGIDGVESESIVEWEESGLSRRDLALIELREGRYPEALEILGKEAERTPDDPLIHILRSLCFHCSRNGKDAYRAITKASKLVPDDPLCNFVLARVFLGLDRGLSAFGSASRVLLAERGTKLELSAREYLMLICRRIGYWEGALQHTDRILELSEMSPSLVSPITKRGAFLVRGVVCGIAGFRAEGVNCFSTAIELDPTKPDAWYNRATALYHLGRNDEAYADLTHVLEISDLPWKVYARRGWCNLRMQHLVDAWFDCHASLELKPSWRDARKLKLKLDRCKIGEIVRTKLRGWLRDANGAAPNWRDHLSTLLSNPPEDCSQFLQTCLHWVDRITQAVSVSSEETVMSTMKELRASGPDVRRLRELVDRGILGRAVLVKTRRDFERYLRCNGEQGSEIDGQSPNPTPDQLLCACFVDSATPKDCWAPFFPQLSLKYPKVLFVLVQDSDSDSDVGGLFGELGILLSPSFAFFRHGTMIGDLIEGEEDETLVEECLQDLFVPPS